jgi:hypothetical protein
VRKSPIVSVHAAASVITPIPTLPGLADPYLKLGRAKMHLDALDLLLKEFTGPKAYAVRRYVDSQQRRYCFECALLDVPDPIPLTLGDAFYNLRSCLDQVVWSLSNRGRKKPPPATTQFPVFDHLPVAEKDVERFDKQVAGVSSKAVTEIKSLQPYQRGTSFKAHPLWRLNALCNIDKHRRIPANGSELIVNFPDITSGDVVGVQRHGKGVVIEMPLDLRVDALNDRHIISVPLANKHKLELDPSIRFKVNFGQGDARNPDKFTVCEDCAGLWDIYNFVAEVVLPRFLRFLP